MHRPPRQPIPSDARDDHFAFFQVGQEGEHSGLVQDIRSQVFYLEAERVAGLLENVRQGSGLGTGSQDCVFGTLEGGNLSRGYSIIESGQVAGYSNRFTGNRAFRGCRPTRSPTSNRRR